ncbi:hypothetical protein [Roseomonas fluvialis]|uniref:hypothetical protein n=1 Tax=Roseomonas fluvialis TaxID=1750527 RepID=UPI001FCC9B4A|nr:hypothetical protein [Roseomonas fluvialis]
MMRCGTLGATLAVALAGTPARADCFDWSDRQVVIEQGALQGLPPGVLRWRIGRMPAHGAHIWTAVELRWTPPGGRIQVQRIFEGMQDGRVLIDRQGSALRLRVTSCSRDADHCRDVPLSYAWDRAAGRFVGATPAARQMLESACTAGEPTR